MCGKEGSSSRVRVFVSRRGDISARLNVQVSRKCKRLGQHFCRGEAPLVEVREQKGDMQFQQRWLRREICAYQIDAMELLRVPYDGQVWTWKYEDAMREEAVAFKRCPRESGRVYIPHP